VNPGIAPSSPQIVVALIIWNEVALPLSNLPIFLINMITKHMAFHVSRNWQIPGYYFNDSINLGLTDLGTAWQG